MYTFPNILNYRILRRIYSRIIALLQLCLLQLSVDAQTIDAGNGHALVLDTLGQVWTIGRNNYGQLGNGSLENSPKPILVRGLPRIRSISRGYDHSLAIDEQGRLYAWGRNNYGQLGINSPGDQLKPVLSNTTLRFKAIEGGYWHSVAIDLEGKVWAWGHNLYAELGNGTREHSLFPAEVRMKENNVIKHLDNVIEIASVGYHTLALRSDGSVWSWGSNSLLELGRAGEEFQPVARRVVGIPPMQSVAVGWHHSVALSALGQIWVWGSDPAFQFKEATLKHYFRPTAFTGLPKMGRIACGSWHSLAIDEHGEVWGWGKNHFGMLGLNDTISRSKPMKIPGLTNIVDIGGGCFQSLARDDNGNLFTFGDNPSGQLGRGNFERCYTPEKMNFDLTETKSQPLLTVPEAAKAHVEPNLATRDYRRDFWVRLVKYSIFLLSLGLNGYLIWRLRMALRKQHTIH